MSNSEITILALISIQCCAIVFSIYSVEKTINKNNKEMLSKIDELNNTIKELESKLEKK
ncbi:hypothetical protein VJI77_06950 [Parvimonas sp. D2]|uniref:hypothetical protein n=1 Tax=unclassified Parvimonas TaxID=1151464 RepID=UPI00020DD01D|nr:MULTISPECIES: hypothetical protein [unclassified Parvimonas]EGL35215.1 hypothetical protein HMPREF9126_1684 [Parvimonas sp. oral taxon 110 str. F0139]MEB3012722.1 hypothetical protein [Parvimonas sp. D2]MEB3088161.1 hypothetical protein [Parvimonas sp. D4]